MSKSTNVTAKKKGYLSLINFYFVIINFHKLLKVIILHRMSRPINICSYAYSRIKQMGWKQYY